MRPGGFQVVVVTVHPEVCEVLGLLPGQDPQRARDVDLHLGVDRRHRVTHLRHEPFVGPADRGHQAELGRTRRRGLMRGRHERGDVETHCPHRRVELPGLRAKVAVLGATARLDRHDPFDFHRGAAPPHPYLVGKGQRVRQEILGQLEHGQRLGLVERHPVLEHLLASYGEDVVHRLGPVIAAHSYRLGSRTPTGPLVVGLVGVGICCARREPELACVGPIYRGREAPERM